MELLLGCSLDYKIRGNPVPELILFPNKSNPSGVLLNVEDWEQLLILLEDLEDAEEIRRARATEAEEIPWEQAISMYTILFSQNHKNNPSPNQIIPQFDIRDPQQSKIAFHNPMGRFWV